MATTHKKLDYAVLSSGYVGPSQTPVVLINRSLVGQMRTILN